MHRIAVLLSGRGSNFRALHAACSMGELDARIVLAAGNRPNAPGLEFAREQGIACWTEDARREPDRSAFDRRLFEAVAQFEPDLIVLAGFMRVITADVVAAHPGRMLNIHPSLLPRWPGLDTHARALAAGDDEHGASVHFVTAELDGGPVIAQVRMPILSGDTPTTLAERLLPREHRLLVESVKAVLGGQVRWTPDGIAIDGRIGAPPLQLEAGGRGLSPR